MKYYRRIDANSSRDITEGRKTHLCCWSFPCLFCSDSKHWFPLKVLVKILIKIRRNQRYFMCLLKSSFSLTLFSIKISAYLSQRYIGTFFFLSFSPSDSFKHLCVSFTIIDALKHLLFSLASWSIKIFAFLSHF